MKEFPKVDPSPVFAVKTGSALTVTTILVSLAAPSASVTVTVSVNVPATVAETVTTPDVGLMVMPLAFAEIEKVLVPVPPIPSKAVEDSLRPIVVTMLEPAEMSTAELTVIVKVSLAVEPETSVTVTVST